jgi:hypothetical protein
MERVDGVSKVRHHGARKSDGERGRIETTSETWDKTRTACFGSLVTPVLLNLFNPSSNPRSGRLARIYKYLAVPGGLVSCCKYLSSTRCHGGGRGFESRRPRHSF